jgi:DNA-binding response OmpR family regulator
MPNLLCVSHEWNLGFEELRALSSAGFRVIPSLNGFEAIKQFASREISAVIVNRRLPDIELCDLLAYFRHHEEDIPIVMLSAVMPLESVPTEVDAVIQKSSCAALVVPTLEVLRRDRRTRTAAARDGLVQAA